MFAFLDRAVDIMLAVALLACLVGGSVIAAVFTYVAVVELLKMTYPFLIMLLFILSFCAGRLEGPGAFLAIGILATIGGLLTGAVSSSIKAAQMVTSHVRGIADTLQLRQLNTAVELTPNENVEEHWTMPIYVSHPKIQPVTDAYTCLLGGRKVLILESLTEEVKNG